MSRRTSTIAVLIIAVAIALLVSITMAAASGEQQLTGSTVASCGFDRVPLVQHHIVFRPKWWFEAVLLLEPRSVL